MKYGSCKLQCIYQMQDNPNKTYLTPWSSSSSEANSASASPEIPHIL
jgi:hypothetical protein